MTLEFLSALKENIYISFLYTKEKKIILLSPKSINLNFIRKETKKYESDL